MKKNIIIVSFVLLITILLSFSNKTKHGFIREASLFDTVKKKDSLRLLDSIKVVDSIRISDSIANLKTRFYKKNVEASHYADKLNGRRTASGKVFHNNNYTAAHKTLKFGTKVKVTNIANNKSVIVTITDRGPFTRHREIDMAKKPFLEISHNKGRAPLRVNIEIVE